MRETTHGPLVVIGALVTIPLAWVIGLWWFSSFHTDKKKQAEDNGLHWPLWTIATLVATSIALFLGLGSILKDATSHGQSTDLITLVLPHFFEHTLGYFVVPFTAIWTASMILWLHLRAHRNTQT